MSENIVQLFPVVPEPDILLECTQCGHSDLYFLPVEDCPDCGHQMKLHTGTDFMDEHMMEEGLARQAEYEAAMKARNNEPPTEVK
ncbi:hypothetical protein KUG85_04675 [Nitratireductor sp. L1-7-SE]|uniref:Uncharacterized protein n=1 Tax=Nitratireductor rhodophyticola TaxID=2854036 RepID=A0ABS7REI8_9HYPH|nr:hypothetical protein [Nitratireductor rhodophyticola]MBY8918832.1 hypothetical protein [Nitratireductor rhodophyticola]MBY8919985.1 hypothetical protein [Nitratireductor rhodophyticola]